MLRLAAASPFIRDTFIEDRPLNGTNPPMTLGRSLGPHPAPPRQTSPIYRLPVEILRKILLHVVSTTLPIYGRSFTDSTRVVPLLAVCRLWRHTALNYSQLFGTVRLDPRIDIRQEESVPVMMRLMDCVAPRVVWIRSDTHPSPDCWVALALALRQPAGASNAIRESRLERLDGELVHISLAALWEIIRPAARTLFDLNLTLGLFDPALRLDLPSYDLQVLRHLSMEHISFKDGSSLRALLNHMPNLKSLHLVSVTGIAPEIDDVGRDNAGDVTHPCLETLVLSACGPKVYEAAQGLRLPALKHLFLIGTRQQTYEAFGQLLFPEDTRPNTDELQTLVLAIDIEMYVDEDEDEDAEEVTYIVRPPVEEDQFGSSDVWDKIVRDVVKKLLSVPTLRHLGLVGLQDPHGLLVEALTPSASVVHAQVQTFLPALSHLDLRSPVQPYATDALQVMLDRRSSASSDSRARLETFKMQEGLLGEGTAEMLRERGTLLNFSPKMVRWNERADVDSDSPRPLSDTEWEPVTTPHAEWAHECSDWKQGWSKEWPFITFV